MRSDQCSNLQSADSKNPLVQSRFAGQCSCGSLILTKNRNFQAPPGHRVPNATQQKLKQAAALHQRGKLLDAKKIYESVLKRKPNNFDALHSLGLVAYQTGNLHQAEVFFAKAITLNPNVADAYNNRGVVLRDLERLDEALASYDKATALESDFALAFFNRGDVLSDLGRLDEALASYDNAIALKPDFAEAYSSRGIVLCDLGRVDEALASYDKAIALKPDFAEAYNNRGNALRIKGNLSRAIEDFNCALEIKPDYAVCYRNYSLVNTFKRDDAIILKMKELLSVGHLSENALMQLYFALSKAEHDLDNKELCINHLIQGNAIRKKYLAYDISQDEKLFASIKQFFDADAANKGTSLVSNFSTTPIFIVGMPRSGTTLVEQIISSHSKVFGAGELEYLDEAIVKSNWRLEKERPLIFSTVRDHYNLKISKVSDAPIITDKLPLNFRWIGFIKNALPKAKIVHLKRNPAAVCWSNLKTYFPAKGMAFSFSIQDIAKYYRLYEDIMEFWRRKYPGKIYDLTYEKLTENQEEETRRLFEYLELTWENNVLEFHKNERAISTASGIQVRQEMYTGSSLEWKKYEQWLQPMLRILNA